MSQISTKIGSFLLRCAYGQRRVGAYCSNRTRHKFGKKQTHKEKTNENISDSIAYQKVDIFRPTVLDYTPNSNASNKPNSDVTSTMLDKSVDNIKITLEDLKSEIEELERLKRDSIAMAEMKAETAAKSGSFVVNSPRELVDPDCKTSNIPCGGCGSILQCNNASKPGFVPATKYHDVRPSEIVELLCYRCQMLAFKKKLVVCDIDHQAYKQVVRKIKKDRALVLMVVDVTDMGNSVIPDYLHKIGKHRPLVILGNKIDLLPKDDKGYLGRIKNRLLQECYRANLNIKDNNIRDVHLVSAKTGYGIEQLINTLIKQWDQTGNLYMVGTVNSGKSTLFNKFLESDYCKASCRDVTQRATVSRWPGTTLNLIQFPIANLEYSQRYQRALRLKEDQHNDSLVLKKKKEFLIKSGKSVNAILFGSVGKTDFRSEHTKEEDNAKYAISGQQFTNYKLNKAGEVTSELFSENKSMYLRQKTIDTESYPESRWAFDTPGLISDKQLINKLTPSELKLLLNYQMIRPHVFVMRPGQVMFISGLARIDYLQGQENTLFAVHTNHFIPVHIVPEEEADQFYTENIGTDQLLISEGGSDRLDKLPSLCGQEFHIRTYKHFVASTDLQLSSLGWVSFSGDEIDLHIRAYTPGGQGMYVRTPALLPNLGTFMGKRLGRSKEYQMKKLKR